MIKVEIIKNKEILEKIVIKGHSMYGESGSDIVCSSVSSIAITSVNGILRYDNSALEYNEHDGHLSINLLKHDEIIDMLISNMIDLLSSLEKQYPKNIKII